MDALEEFGSWLWFCQLLCGLEWPCPQGKARDFCQQDCKSRQLRGVCQQCRGSILVKPNDNVGFWGVEYTRM